VKLTVANLVAALIFGLFATPPAAQAQTDRTYRIGIVRLPTAEGQSYFETFRAAMRDLGYLEGSNLILDLRIPDLDMRQVPALVDELIALKPDVLVGNEKTAQVMRAKTPSIPIVLTNALDPVRAGLAQSVRRPGMNVTGSAQLNDLLPAKHIDIMREILPRLARIGQLVDTTQSGCKVVEEAARQAARSVGAVLVPYYVENRAEIERAFSQMEKERPDVLLPCPSAVLFNHRDLLFENAVRLRIPFTSFVVANVPKGVLFAYAASVHEMYRRAATYVDKILKGATPGDLPIEQPMRFELVINMNTSRALGITIPPSVLLRADRVIE
jgi:putative ABC transport system substrate-binding protein